jgi:hypothetical protein
VSIHRASRSTGRHRVVTQLTGRPDLTALRRRSIRHGAERQDRSPWPAAPVPRGTSPPSPPRTAGQARTSPITFASPAFLVRRSSPRRAAHGPPCALVPPLPRLRPILTLRCVQKGQVTSRRVGGPHNPEVAGSNPAPATEKVQVKGLIRKSPGRAFDRLVNGWSTSSAGEPRRTSAALDGRLGLLSCRLSRPELPGPSRS